MTKPDDYDTWSQKDKDDYTHLMNATVITSTELGRMSDRVLQAAAADSFVAQFIEAYETTQEKPVNMKDRIQALLDQIHRDFPDGCRGMNCTTCPLRTTKDGVKHYLCQTLTEKMHYRLPR